MSEKRGTILFVEDDKFDQMAFCRFAKDEAFPYDYVLAGSVKDAAGKLAESKAGDLPVFVAVILDYLLGDGTAFELFSQLNGTPVILVTGTGDIEVAIKAMKKGACDYLEKDPHGNYLRALAITIENAVIRRNADDELIHYKLHLEELVAKRTSDLQEAVTKYKRAEQQVEQALTMQRMINSLLQAALEPGTIEEHLSLVLDKIIDLPWSEMEKRGAVFLVDPENSRQLLMKTEIGLDQRAKDVCKQVAFGTCVCGRAALSGKIQIVDGADDRHEIYLTGSREHTHYGVPILSSGKKVLGVISLYFKPGHTCSALEEENLIAIARNLAAIIEHFRANRIKEELQEQLMQSQKMESIGRLAGGVAHDFNNILSAINGYAELILLKLSQDDPMKGYAEIILASGERAAGLTQQLLSFSRKEVVKPKVLNLNRVIKEGQLILSRIIGEDITVEIRYGENLWEIKADPTQLNQIIMNLAVNARDAMPDGGRMIIETINVVFDGNTVNASSQRGVGEYVKLQVADSGIGMSKEVMAQIFEPFFTTKDVDKGTGLGLSTVYGIVQQNGGHIKVESEKGKGSTFTICFPRTIEKALVRGIADSSVMPKGSETILVAEDNQQVRGLLVNVLESLGYTVLVAENGLAALEISRGGNSFDLLVTDVIMPGMGGRELFAKISQEIPSIKVLFMSGYTGDSAAIQDVLNSGVEFLQKPILLESLAQMVRKVLDYKHSGNV